MNKIILAAACITLLVPAADAHPTHDTRSEVECEKTKQKIKKLQSRMRQGYTRAQGEKWSEQLRELRAIRSQQCR